MKRICKEQDCSNCEMHFYTRLYDDWDEGCELGRDMFEPCYMPKLIRKIYKKILIPFYGWRVEIRIKKDDKKRMKLGYTEEEWFDMKFR